MTFAVVFPGQGSQSTHMLADYYEASAEVRSTFEQASDVLGYDLWGLIADNPDDTLNRTEYTQPAMLAAGVAVWRDWCARDLPAPGVLAGHSLGEYTALVAAESLSFADALKAVRHRGRLMQAAVPAGEGAMAAVLGLDDARVREVCQSIMADGSCVEAVNFNAPGQVVIAGDSGAVTRAVEAATAAGAKRAVLLPVSVPSHSSLMADAAEQLLSFLQEVEIRPPRIRVLHNIDARSRTEPGQILSALKRQLHSPVLWSDTIGQMLSDDVTAVLEFGPGKVLTGLCKRINRRLPSAALDSPGALDKVVSLVQGETA